MRVLIGVDGSPGSFAAVQFAGRILAAGTDEVFLYYSPPPVYVRATHDASGTAGALQGYLTTAVFDKARQQLPEPLRAPTQTIIGSRDARQGLLVAADECRADLLVIGARGVGPLKQPEVGSIARHVVHQATIPVLVVRGAALAATKPIHVLLASDGTAISQHASDVLRHFSWPPGTTGRTITVLESTPEGKIPQWLVEQLTDEQLAALGMGHFARDVEEEARIRQDAARWHGILPGIFHGRDPVIMAGHASDQILKAIDAHGIDLVVVGARRQGAIRRLLLGSTSEQVLTHAPCSVLIVRGHEQP
jgi:nucleotide-binding universal stress UspA family protein